MPYAEESDQHQPADIIPFIPEGDFYYTKGIQAFKKRKFEIALKWLKKAREAEPGNPLYECQSAVIYTEMGSYHKANQILLNVVEQSGDDYVDGFYLLANNYAHLGLMNDAKKYANYYLEKEPKGHFSEDAFDLVELLKLDEEEWDEEDTEDELLMYQETVFYYIEHQDWKKAYPLLKDMLVLFPEHIPTYHDMAYCMFQLGEEKQAIEKELTCLSKDPASLYSYINLALFYYEQNNRQKYEYYSTMLVNIFPMHDHQKLRIATTFSIMGYYEKALNRFQSLTTSLVKNHVSYFKWYSYALFNVGYIQKARKTWKDGCARHPILESHQPPWSI